MPSFFDDILERANKLHSDVNLGTLSEFPSFSKPTSSNASNAKFKFDSGLADIFRHSEEMWKQKKLSQDEETSSFAALKVSKDLNHLRATSLPFGRSEVDNTKAGKSKVAYSAFDEAALGPSGAGGGAYEEYSMREIERYVENSFERARIESERTFFNEQFASEPNDVSAANSSYADYTTPTDPFNKLRRGTPIAPGSNLNQPLEYTEGVFAQKIDIALYKNCRAVIKHALQEAVNEIDDKEVTNIWRKAFTICLRMIAEDDSSVVELRSSRRWAEHVTSSSTKFLQDCYKEHMESIVENALELANRGGVPGTLPLVEAFLNVKRLRYSGVEDGNFNSHPIWMVLFYCLRMGDLSAVAEVAKELTGNSRCPIIVGVLGELQSSPRIEPETKMKLLAEWRPYSATCRDPFKKAVYGVFLGLDCPDVSGTIEDWLWMRLICCRLNYNDMTDSLRQLQNTISNEFGEDYFVRQGGNYLLYYSALMLTGQIEQAVYALFRSNMLVHAVHIAILAYQMKLLILTPKISDEILKPDPNNPMNCQLNFARVVLRYMKNFELTNINFALNYSFFLNKLELDATFDNKSGRNVFKSCVSRLVYLTGEKNQILGRLDEDGRRVPGLIDKFSTAFNVTDVISYVAADTNICGDTLEACKLYALAEKPNDAVKLTCRLLSARINAFAKCGDKAAIDALKEAYKFAESLGRYRQHINVEKNNISMFCLLMDLYQFFTHFSAKEYGAAFKVMQGIQFLPFAPEDVQTYVNSFEMMEEEVRLLLPEICVAFMKTTVSLYEKEPKGSPQRALYSSISKAIILYTAMVPYKFPVSTNSQLLQLQSRIS